MPTTYPKMEKVIEHLTLRIEPPQYNQVGFNFKTKRNELLTKLWYRLNTCFYMKSTSWVDCALSLGSFTEHFDETGLLFIREALLRASCSESGILFPHFLGGDVHFKCGIFATAHSRRVSNIGARVAADCRLIWTPIRIGYNRGHIILPKHLPYGDRISNA